MLDRSRSDCCWHLIYSFLLVTWKVEVSPSVRIGALREFTLSRKFASSSQAVVRVQSRRKKYMRFVEQMSHMSLSFVRDSGSHGLAPRGAPTPHPMHP